MSLHYQGSTNPEICAFDVHNDAEEVTRKRRILKLVQEEAAQHTEVHMYSS